MEINERMFENRTKYPFLFLDYLFWLIFDFSKFKVIRKDKIKKVLIIHTGAIGELVVITPIIRELKKQFKCQVDCMVKESMVDLLVENPYIDNLVVYEKDFRSNLNKLKGKGYDLAVIFQASFKNSVLCYKAGIKYRIGGYSRIKRFPTFLYTRRTFPIGLKHTLDYNFEIIGKAGAKKPVNAKTEIFISKNNEKKMVLLLKKLKVKNYALIQPGFGPIGKKSPPREWSSEKYALIADYLFKKYKLSTLLVGLKEQEKTILGITSKSKYKKNMINMAGKTSIQQLCSLISKAKIVIAPDTGTSHIAAALDTPLVNLMDAPIEEWGPVGDKSKIINIYHPRIVKLFKNFKLLEKKGGVRDISSEEVERAVDKLIKK